MLAARFDLSGAHQLETLKPCLDTSVAGWFKSWQKKLGFAADWSAWKKSIMITFGDETYRSSNYVHNFKFLNGFLVEYPYVKRLILDLDLDIPPKLSMEQLFSKSKVLDQKYKEETKVKLVSSSTNSKNSNFNVKKSDSDKVTSTSGVPKILYNSHWDLNLRVSNVGSLACDNNV